MFENYEDAELGYAVTDHAAQGRTVTAGLAVITGTEDRQHAYVALSRGTDVNTRLRVHRLAQDRRPGPGPAPGPRTRPLRPPRRRPGGPAAPAATPPGEALAVLAGVLDRDGQQHSATQTRNQALADADHLAILHAIWAAETTPARDQRYRALLLGALPPGYRRAPGHQAKWLWRTLRAAELAGLDPAQVLADAIAERDLAGSRDIAAVLDARIRHRLGTLVPLPSRPWSEQVPALADPERRAYVAEIAALMDARKDRIGEHAADHPPAWATAALGPVPADPPDRLELAETGRLHRRLARTVRLRPPRRPDRPRTGRGRPRRPGRLARGPGRPRPGRRPGRARHARRQAAAPARHLPGRDRLGPPVRRGRAAPGPRRRLGRPPGRPARRRRGPRRRTARRPRPRRGPAQAGRRLPGPGAGLPAARGRLRHGHGRPRRLGHTPPAPSASWPSPPTPNCAAATPASTSRRCARPNPSPPPAPSATNSPSPRTQPPGEIDQWITDLAAGHRTFAGKLADRQSQTIPSEDPDYGDLGPAFPAWTSPGREPILQPPKPEIPPSPQILQRAMDRDADWEAAD